MAIWALLTNELILVAVVYVIVALAAGVELIELARAVDRLDAGDVVARKRLLDSVVGPVHHV